MIPYSDPAFEVLLFTKYSTPGLLLLGAADRSVRRIPDLLPKFHLLYEVVTLAVGMSLSSLQFKVSPETACSAKSMCVAGVAGYTKPYLLRIFHSMADSSTVKDAMSSLPHSLPSNIKSFPSA